MPHASPQFTPAQLIDAGRRAEAEGRLDLAAQFYRYLTEHFAETAEAAEARSSLGRIGTAPSEVWNAVGGGAAGLQAARPQRRRPPARRDHYPLGRALAFLFSSLGALVALAGVAALPAYFLAGAAGTGLPWVGLLPMAGGAVGLFIVGSVVALAGQIARALFDQASAARDLLALERTRLGLD